MQCNCRMCWFCYMLPNQQQIYMSQTNSPPDRGTWPRRGGCAPPPRSWWSVGNQGCLPWTCQRGANLQEIENSNCGKFELHVSYEKYRERQNFQHTREDTNTEQRRCAERIMLPPSTYLCSGWPSGWLWLALDLLLDDTRQNERMARKIATRRPGIFEWAPFPSSGTTRHPAK